MTKILLANNDIQQYRLIMERLRHNNYQLHRVETKAQLMTELKHIHYDLVLFDTDLSTTGNMQFVQSICLRFPIPLIMFIRDGDRRTKLRAYKYGADHVLEKSVIADELISIIQAILRRINIELSRNIRGTYPAGSIQDKLLRLPFTQTEMTIIRCLAQQPGVPLSKEALQTQVTGRVLGKHDRNLDMHISKIRSKLVQAGMQKDLIKTIRGVGYALVV